MQQELWICQLGVLEYREALALQERVRAARQAGELPDVLLLLEHHPVYTRGRRSSASELPMGESWYLSQGIDVVDSDRGGKLTYHGPGQLVGYPIMRVEDVIGYLRSLERAIIAALSDARVDAHVSEGLTGVWAGERKIASIGVHLSRSVTTHGFAVNVQNDLQPFNWVHPCGLEDVQMTSVVKETHRIDPLPAFREQMAQAFTHEFGLRARGVPPDSLNAARSAL
ncbi:MAG: lipoyl(octanoyl) transferase LipB [Solirubrobacteraceae bacterium]